MSALYNTRKATDLVTLSLGQATKKKPEHFYISVTGGLVANGISLHERSLFWIQLDSVFLFCNRSHETIQRKGCSEVLPEVAQKFQILRKSGGVVKDLLLRAASSRIFRGDWLKTTEALLQWEGMEDEKKAPRRLIIRGEEAWKEGPGRTNGIRHRPPQQDSPDDRGEKKKRKRVASPSAGNDRRSRSKA
ncbi:hypothetical protein TNCV_730341 [Trichonephila clavipes]|nr:hypothetical protein TNCV_730341 [Trichonephila clavipes]